MWYISYNYIRNIFVTLPVGDRQNFNFVYRGARLNMDVWMTLAEERTPHPESGMFVCVGLVKKEEKLQKRSSG